MEVESRDPASVGPPAGADSTTTNGEQNLPWDLGMDDSRSSSLSDPEDVSENAPSEYEVAPRERPPLENDSEAETERLEESPNNFRSKQNIVVSAPSYGPSPSKLAQSTTYDDVEEDEEPTADDSPSKPRARNNGISPAAQESPMAEDSALSESAGKKRKRLGSGDDVEADLEGDEPLKKRRSSLKSELSEPPAEGSPLSPEPAEEPSKANQDHTPAEDIPESDLQVAPAKAKRGKKGKRRTRKARDADEETEAGAAEPEGAADDHPPEDEDAAEREEPDDAETAAKHEEESAKRMSAMDSLSELEKEFATLRDKIYDERISKLNRELEMLKGPNPTHSEYLRQLECVTRYRDDKIKYESTLFQYRTKSLLNKSLAERAQAHSTYFQRVRDLREKYSGAVSKQFYAIQRDRFKTEEISPHHSVPFPTSRSDQIAQQTAYNQEVSILSGVAKYVGFPAAPDLSSARPAELEEDLEKMGISIEARAPQPQPSAVSRGPVSAMSNNVFRTAAEEAFLEQTPWANPQHPIHQQQVPQGPQTQAFERVPPFTTPAAQKRMVDINAPNGSASTIPENASAANSSTNNTPFGAEQEPHSYSHRQPASTDHDPDKKIGSRSLSSSPLGMRKPQPPGNAVGHHRSVPDVRTDTASRNPAHSPSSTRLGLFASKRDSSPSLHSKPVNPIHPSNQMVAR